MSDSRIARTLARLFRNPADIEDAMQESHLRLHQQQTTGEVVQDPNAFLYTTAKRLLLDGRRREKTALTHQPAIQYEHSQSSTLTTFISVEEQERLERRREAAIAEAREWLSPIERDCLDLRGQGLTFREIAEHHGIRLRRVVTIVDRAIKKLRKKLQELLDERA